MGTKVEQSSNHGLNIASGSKISKFATKSGFLIPKNKLSGSLVPFIRGGKKGGGDAANGEHNKEGQRKTKWGPDLTQDTAVRKGRALAYQARVDQITQQLRLGKLESENSHCSPSPSQIEEQKSLDHQVKDQELLEFERREAIGEILKLNPSYKAPADYKPVLKEAKVPIPNKDNTAYNVVGLIFGSANDTQKRLEKETGAKVRVYGTRAVNGEKVEVTTVDEYETHGAFDELHVHVSADTYEKIDAAMALVELLVTPVSENPASGTMTPTTISGDNMNTIAPSQGTPGTDVSAGVVNGMVQESGPAPSSNHPQKYSGRWYPTGAPQTPVLPSSGFAAPANSSAPFISNGVQFPSSAMPSMFGPRPVGMQGFSPVPQNTSFVPSGPQPPQILQRPYASHPSPLGHAAHPGQPSPIQSNIIAPPQLSVSHSASTGPSQFGSSAALSYQPPASAGSSNVPLSTPTSIGAGNMMSVVPGTTGQQGHFIASHPLAVSGAAQPNTQQSALPLAGAAVNQHPTIPYFNSSSHFQQGISPSLPSAAKLPAPVQPVMRQVVMPNSSPNMIPGSTHLVSPMTSSSTLRSLQSGIPNSGPAGAVSFNAITSGMTAPRPLQPSSNDFTFQPHRPQNPSLEVPHRPNTQPVYLHPNQSVQPYRESQTSSLQPAMRPAPTNTGFSRPDNIGNQMMHPRAQTSVNFPSSPSAHPGPPRHAPFPGQPATPLPQPRNFGLAPPFVNADGFPRQGAPIQLQQNHPVSATRPPSFLAPNQQLFNSNMPFPPAARLSSVASGVQQVYDPFAPTTQFGSNRANMQKQESDPEYEDLMASVGVK